MGRGLIFLLFTLPLLGATTAVPSKARLGLADFRPGAGVSKEEAQAASDLLRTELVKSEAYEVLDRNNLAKTLREQALQQSGLVDEKSAVRLGRQLGAQYFVYGTFQKVGRVYFLTLDVVSIETSQIIKSARDRLERMEDLGDSAKKMANEISGITQKRNTAAYVKKGHGLLSIKTQPAGAQVSVNGLFAGETDLLTAVPMGVARIRISRAGHLPLDLEEVIKEGEVHDLSAVLVKGLGLEEALANRDRWQKELVRHAVLAGASSAILATALLVAGSYNESGRLKYAQYQGAVTPVEIGQTRTEYQNAFNTADGLYYVAESATLVGVAFLVLTAIDIIRLKESQRVVDRWQKTSAPRFEPGVGPRGLFFQVTAAF